MGPLGDNGEGWRYFRLVGGRLIPTDPEGNVSTPKPTDWTKIDAYRKDLAS